MNSRATTYRITSSELKTLFRSNHVKLIQILSTSFNIPCIVETKDTDIFIWTIYSYVVQQPEHDWLMEADKDSFVNIRKIYEKFGITTCLLLPQFHTITVCDTVCFKTSSIGTNSIRYPAI